MIADTQTSSAALSTASRWAQDHGPLFPVRKPKPLPYRSVRLPRANSTVGRAHTSRTRCVHSGGHCGTSRRVSKVARARAQSEALKAARGRRVARDEAAVGDLGRERPAKANPRRRIGGRLIVM